MLIKIAKGWELSENLITPEHVALNRRAFMTGAGAIAASIAAPELVLAAADPSASLYPVPRNKRYRVRRPITPERVSATYNNFYEFGSHKRIAGAAQALKIRPWEVAIDGEVEKPFKIGIDDLLKKMPLQERVYRFRCVEAWAMTVPWSGFPLKALVALANPLSSARYVRMETFLDPAVARGQRARWYPWPYVEGLTIDEAANDLAFMVTGAYGKPLPKQFGAPMRLTVPWKYGFKHVKSIVRVSFTSKRPKTFWEVVQPKEYGFWANVNPDVAHPRWSQARERLLGSNESVPTRIYNGYGPYVADLYKGMKQTRRLFM